MINLFLNNQRSINAKNLKVNINLVMQEILKMFMSQISLKKLSYTYNEDFSSDSIKNIIKVPGNKTFVHFLGTRDCLTNLSELSCNSNVPSKKFYQLNMS